MLSNAQPQQSNKSKLPLSMKTEKAHSTTSSNVFKKEDLKINKHSESAFITSVNKLSYCGPGGKPYDFSQPIDEREENRGIMSDDIMASYNMVCAIHLYSLAS
jgi:hypothetical protein